MSTQELKREIQTKLSNVNDEVILSQVIKLLDTVQPTMTDEEMHRIMDKIIEDNDGLLRRLAQ